MNDWSGAWENRDGWQQLVLGKEMVENLRGVGKEMDDRSGTWEKEIDDKNGSSGKKDVRNGVGNRDG